MKREDYISWDEYFMGIAQLSANRSKDPSTQVGSCIVDSNHRILSIGYNGAPNGIDDEQFPWAREGNPLETKYLYVCHSELNAVMNCKGKDLTGATIYVTLFPCNECTKLIIQSGIKRVVYDCDKYADTDGVIASKKLLDLAGIQYEKYQSHNRKIEIEV
jgi:dCMP deaminase